MRHTMKDLLISFAAGAALISAGGVAFAQDEQDQTPEKTWEKAKDHENMKEAEKEAMEASELAPAAGKNKAHEKDKKREEQETPPQL